MKAEINNENKAKFFAQYWGQSVCFVPFINQDVYVNEHMPWKDRMLEKKYLNLKPLSSISDEDAIEVAKILYPMYSAWEINKANLPSTLWVENMANDEYSFCLANDGLEAYLDGPQIMNFQTAVDFLRSRGYALPFMGLSVEEMVGAGWIKLTSL